MVLNHVTITSCDISAMDPDEYHACCLFMAVFTQFLIQFRFMMMSYVRRQVEWQEMFHMADAQYNDNVQFLVESHARGLLARGSWLLQHAGIPNLGRRNHPYRRYVSRRKGFCSLTGFYSMPVFFVI